MRILIAMVATVGLVLPASLVSDPANAKIYQAAYLGKGALKGTCKRGGGTYHESTTISHSCTYKNGNVRDCSSKSKTCVVITPDKARVAPTQTSVGGVPAGGILDSGPGLGTQGPAATGTPLAPAAPAPRPNIIN